MSDLELERRWAEVDAGLDHSIAETGSGGREDEPTGCPKCWRPVRVYPYKHPRGGVIGKLPPPLYDAVANCGWDGQVWDGQVWFRVDGRWYTWAEMDELEASYEVRA